MASVVAALAESSVIATVVLLLRNALTDNSTNGQLDMGVVELRPEAAVLGAAAALLATAALQAYVARSVATLSTDYLASVRKRALASYRDAEHLEQSNFGVTQLQELAGAISYQASLLPMRLASMVSAGAGAIALICVALVVDYAAALAMLLAAALMTLVMRPLSQHASHLSTEYIASQQVHADAVSGWADLARDLRVLGVEEPAFDATASQVEDTASALTRLRFALELNVVLYRVLAVTVLLIVAFLATQVEVGDAARALVALAVVLRAITFGQQFNAAQQLVTEATAPAAKVAELTARLTDAQRPLANASVDQFEVFTLDTVSYRYPQADIDALRDITVQIRRGERVAIVGSSGSGKTTLVRVLLGLVQPSSGTAAVNRVPAVAVSEASRRRLLGFAAQDSSLMPATVRENVRFFRDIGEKDVEAAMNNLAPELNVSLEKKLGPRGIGLSGGQAQRVSLARALVNRAEVLVLDEPTSALDERTEREVTDALASLPSHQTLVLVTHRRHPLTVCDRFLVVRDGSVSEYSSLDEVLNLLPSDDESELGGA